MYFIILFTEQNIVRQLVATPLTSEAIMLSWNPPENQDDVVAYTITAQMPSGKQRRAELSSDITSIEIDELRPFVKYTFKVQTMQVCCRIISHGSTVNAWVHIRPQIKIIS